jgi:hypothetical protein
MVRLEAAASENPAIDTRRKNILRPLMALESALLIPEKSQLINAVIEISYLCQELAHSF